MQMTVKRCFVAQAGGEAYLYFLTYSLNVPHGNPGAGLPLSYIIACQDAISWADRPGQDWLWWPQTVYDTISVRFVTLGRNLRDVHIDYLIGPDFFFLKEIIRTPQVFGAGTPYGDAVSWSDCTNMPNPLNPGKIISFMGRLATFSVRMAHNTLPKAVWLSMPWLWSCIQRVGQQMLMVNSHNFLHRP